MDSNYIITPDGSFVNADELCHHGVLGMKWGVRRYQNSDGSLTAAGRKRYTNPDGALNKKGKKFYAKESERLRKERKNLTAQKHTAEKFAKLDAKRKANAELKNQLNPKKETKAETPKKKSISEMTDEELNAAINRARMEDTYRQLRPAPVSKNKEFMNKVIKDLVIPKTIDAGKALVDKMIKDATKDKVDPNSYEALKKQYDKLTIQKKLEALKRGEDPEAKPLSWDDKIKQQTYEANERKYAKEREEAAAKDAERIKAEAAAKKRNRQKNRNVLDRLNKNDSHQEDRDFYDRVHSQQKEYDFDYSNTKNSKVDGSGNSSKKATGQAASNASNKKSNSSSSPFGNNYEKRVDKLLKEMDDKGWEMWYKEYGGR